MVQAISLCSLIEQVAKVSRGLLTPTEGAVNPAANLAKESMKNQHYSIKSSLLSK